MKKNLKTELTKERIVEAGLIEFSENGFNGFKINNLCTKHNISKGIFYHNFSGKDDLYLECVRQSFGKAISYMKKDNKIPDLKEYMERRHEFLKDFPYHSKIFFEALLSAPIELYESIKNIRNSFIDFNTEVCNKLVLNSILKKGLDEKKALNYLILIQEMFRAYFYSKNYFNKNLQEITEEYENTLKEALEFMLYGIFEKE